MKKFGFFLAITACVLAASAEAQSLMRVDQPLYYMTAMTPALAQSKRAALIQSIWGNAAPVFPTIVTFPGDGNGGQLAPAYFGRPPATGAWLAFYMENGVVARTYYATFSGSTCLAIVNGGHSEGFFNVSNSPTYLVPSVDSLVRQIAAKPCDIILNSMPLNGENGFAASYVGLQPDQLHDRMATTLAPATGTALKYFMIPPLGSLSYALSQRGYDKIVALGISGGGWASTLEVAIDTRIQRSYAVAGSVPLAYRAALPEGDWEQYNVPVDYLDLYAMGMAESGRSAFLFYNGKDGCCFQAGGIFPWAAPLGSILSSFPGKFGVYMVYASSNHEIRPEVANFIMNDLAQ